MPRTALVFFGDDSGPSLAAQLPLTFTGKFSRAVLFSPTLPVSAKLAAIIGRRRPLRLQATAHTAGLAARKGGRVQFRVVPSSKWLWNPNRPAGCIYSQFDLPCVTDGLLR